MAVHALAPYQQQPYYGLSATSHPTPELPLLKQLWQLVLLTLEAPWPTEASPALAFEQRLQQCKPLTTLNASVASPIPVHQLPYSWQQAGWLARVHHPSLGYHWVPTVKGWCLAQNPLPKLPLAKGEFDEGTQKQSTCPTVHTIGALHSVEELLQSPNLSAGQQKVYQALRQCRQYQAQRKGVKLYHVCSNAALQQMACSHPLNEQSLSLIRGVGKQFMQHHAVPFLDTLIPLALLPLT